MKFINRDLTIMMLVFYFIQNLVFEKIKADQNNFMCVAYKFKLTILYRCKFKKIKKWSNKSFS